MITHHSAEIRVRRYDGVAQCDVVVSFRGHAMTLRCRNYDQAVDWARIECNKKNPPLATGPSSGETPAMYFESSSRYVSCPQQALCSFLWSKLRTPHPQPAVRISAAPGAVAVSFFLSRNYEPGGPPGILPGGPFTKAV